MNTIIQIPIDKKVRDRVEKEAKNQGFSSIQDMVRLFFSQVINNQAKIRFEAPPVRLSKKAITRYDNMTREIEEGKVKLKQFTSIKDLMADLNYDS